MNKITINEIKKITPIISSFNVSDIEVFDYLKIVDLNKVPYEKRADNVLFFFSYPTREELSNGWYTKNFDLRPKCKSFFNKFPEYTFVIEKDMQKIVTDNNLKYIVVENIRTMLTDIYNYVLKKNKAKVIAFTGSVGKTTAVGLMESILKQKYNVLRIYSKRITPIVLQANIINFFDENVDYIVVENSLYYSNHIKTLNNMLKNDIVAILNIKSIHIGIEKIRSIDDVCIYKTDIMRHAKDAYLNLDNIYLQKLSVDSGNVMYDKKTLFKNKKLKIHGITNDRIKILDDKFLIDDRVLITPFVTSSLSMIQYLICYDIAKKEGLSDDQIVKGMNGYIPVENRLHKEKAFEKEIFFDGDITTYSRMHELSNIIATKKYLVLRKVGSAERGIGMEKIINFFDRFHKVFLFSDIEYLEELKGKNNVVIVENHDFMKNLDGVIVYHYSGYYRVWDKFLEQNLNIYDREKYVIKK